MDTYIKCLEGRGTRYTYKATIVAFFLFYLESLFRLDSISQVIIKEKQMGPTDVV